MTPFSASFGPASLPPSSPGPAQQPLPPSSAGIPIRGATSIEGWGPSSSIGGYVGTPGARTSFLFDRGHHDPITAPSNIHDQKMLSPEQVVEIAESLKSPVLKSEEDDAFSTSFSSSLGGRLSRSSSGRRNHQRSGSGPSLNRGGSFNRGKFASDLSFTTPEDERRASSSTPGQQEPLELEPMEYVEMNDDVFLPYVDRPAEVDELLDQPSNVSFIYKFWSNRMLI